MFKSCLCGNNALLVVEPEAMDQVRVSRGLPSRRESRRVFSRFLSRAMYIADHATEHVLKEEVKMELLP